MEAGAAAVLGREPELPAGCDLVVTSPGWRPDLPLFAQAAAAGLEVWGDVELAWRLRPADRPMPWLALTGTNGKTTAVRMLASMLQAAGIRAVAAGNVGTALLDVVGRSVRRAGPGAEQLPAALDPQYARGGRRGPQRGPRPPRLAWLDATRTPRPRAASTRGASEPASTTSPIRRPSGSSGRPTSQRAAGPWGSPWAPRDPVSSVSSKGCWSTAPSGPTPGPLRRSWPASTMCSPRRLTRSPTRWPPPRWPVPTASPRPRCGPGCAGSDPIRTGWPWSPGWPTVDYVDDSKATNGHAAAASLAAYDSVVWLAGGLAKGATFDELVLRARGTAARSRPDRARSGGAGRRAGATRARGAGDRDREHRD